MAEEKSNSGEKLILIIANRPKNFESAANFLSRRGCPCSAVSDIRQAIKIITSKKPAYVFLSWNLKNAKIQQTYSLITKTFKVTTVVFAELTDSKTAAELSNARFPETMQAPVSGPGIYMRVQKIEKAMEDLEAVANQEPLEKSIHPEDVPKDGTWESAGSDPVTGQQVWRFSSNTSNLKGHYTFKGKRPPRKSNSGAWETDDGAAISFKAIETTSENAPTDQLSDSDIDALAEKILQDKSMAGKGPLTGEVETEEDEYGSIMKIGAKQKTRESSILQSSDEKKANELKKFEQTTPSETNYLDKNDKSASKEHQVNQTGKKEKDFSFSQSQGAEGIIGDKRSETAELKLSGRDAQSILAKSSAKALQDSVKPNGENVMPIDFINKAIVFTVKSSRFKGFLVVSSGDNDDFDPEVLGKLKEKLPAYMSEQGETLSNLEITECKLSGVKFLDWSSEDAEFSAVVGHKNHQWAISYFPDENALPEVTAGSDTEMVSVDMLDVLPEAPLPFDIYIYLPVNNKHFLYVKRGKKLGKAQRDRLKGQSVSHFFIKNESIQDFKKFCIENKLAYKVSEYQIKKQAS